LKQVRKDAPSTLEACDTIDPTLQTLEQAAAKIIQQLDATAPAGTKAAIAAVTNKVETIVGNDINQAKELIQRYATATDAAFVNLEKWFNSAQDRAQQWFTLHTRWITIAGAFVAAFVLQLDTIDLLKRISTDSDLRTKLVAVSGTIQQQADKVLKDDQRTVIDKALQKTVVAKLVAEHFSLPQGLDDHADFATMDDAKTWLSEKLAANKDKDAIIAEYERLVNAAKLDAYLTTMQKLVGATGLDLIPSPYPLIRNGEWSWPKRRLLGILISAALLSLGAPFWYNTLKSLTNLRPTLANAVEKNPKQSGAPPGK
jgi:DNA-binding transcriptional regulator YbjK